MKGMIGNEGILVVGEKILIESFSPANSYGAFFEDEGTTGYFYALDNGAENPVLDALQIYNVSDVTDGHIPSKLQIAWSNDGLKAALVINDYVHAVFNFELMRGYCRTGFPPINSWSKEGHEWSDTAIELFN